MERVGCKGRDAGRRRKGGPACCRWLPCSFLHRRARTAQTPTPGYRSAPASVAFLKGQVLTTRGRGLKPRTRGIPSTSGRRSKGRFDFRAIAERPAEQREKSPSRPRAQATSARKVSTCSDSGKTRDSLWSHPQLPQFSRDEASGWPPKWLFFSFFF